MFSKISVNLALILCSTTLAIGLSASGYFVGRSIERFKSHDRTVVVKGLSEREVKADLAIWTLSFKNSGTDLTILERKLEQDKQAVIEFFKECGFAVEDIQIGTVSVAQVTDTVTKDNGHVESINRFNTDGSVTLHTSNVDLVTQSTVRLSELLRKGVIVSGAPFYHYTKFPALRPEMIAEATQSARQAALQFASDSGSKVGSIRTANQGTFTINPRDSYGEGADYTEIYSVNKKIRVVSTVTFGLE